MSLATARRWLATCLAAALTGCASPTAPVLLVLPSTETAAHEPPTTTFARRVLALRRTELPEYLLAHRVRYRSDDSTLAEWPNVNWAERIEVSVAREFNHTLRQRLAGWQVCEANCSEQSSALALQVKLTSMDYVRSEQRLKGEVRLSLWSADRPARLLHTQVRAYVVDGDGDTPQAQARAMSAFLVRVAADAALVVLSNP